MRVRHRGIDSATRLGEHFFNSLAVPLVEFDSGTVVRTILEDVGGVRVDADVDQRLAILGKDRISGFVDLELLAVDLDGALTALGGDFSSQAPAKDRFSLLLACDLDRLAVKRADDLVVVAEGAVLVPLLGHLEVLVTPDNATFRCDDRLGQLLLDPLVGLLGR